MAKRNQGAKLPTWDEIKTSASDGETFDVVTLTDADVRAPAAFVEGLASAPPPPPEAIAAAASVIADIVTGSADALKHADIIAAFYAGKKLGALELCAHLENNWGAECGIAARDWRTKLEAVPS